MLLVIAVVILSGTLIKSSNAQSRNVDGALLVEVQIDRAPAVLLLDTGAERSLLDREFAQRLGLRPVGFANIQKPYSSDQSELVLIPNLDIQSVRIKDMTMLTDDLAASSEALGVHIDGILGNDILGKFAVTLDYSTGSVTFGPISAVHHGVPIKLRRIGDRYFANLKFGGVPLSFLLDTGTNFSSLSQGGWSKLNQDKRPLPAIDGVRSSGTSATSKLVCFPRMLIGRAFYENLPMRVLPPTSAGILSNPDISGLLGSDFLMRFVVLLDFANDSLYLSPDPNFKPDQDRFSTIGIQFVKDPTGFFTVMAVWSPTPASEANFNVGDQILSANGLSTIEMPQEDLSSQLHGKPGREIQVDISSHGSQRTVRLAIRNLLCQERP
ncbi:aspartyl protease family protein [Tunturiibacter gelidiferens]|uniref:retroviral-like aspartic protease family protein n=1 Tax=Tunturiibacter gelidiferens TaxID=3069689 RepID=UPI003D9AEB07